MDVLCDAIPSAIVNDLESSIWMNFERQKMLEFGLFKTQTETCSTCCFYLNALLANGAATIMAFGISGQWNDIKQNFSQCFTSVSYELVARCKSFTGIPRTQQSNLIENGLNSSMKRFWEIFFHT